MNLKNFEQTTNNNNDLIAVALSFSGQFIQLFLVVMGGLSQFTFAGKYFVFPELIPLISVVSLIVSLVLVGTVSFFKKSKTMFIEENNWKIIKWLKSKFMIDPTKRKNVFSNEAGRKEMLFGSLLLIVLAILFILTTFEHVTRENIRFLDTINSGVVQIVSYMGLWVLTTLILYNWISLELEKKNQFKQGDFLINLVNTMQSHGFIQIKVYKNIPVPNTTDRIVALNIQSKDIYLYVSFDGKTINELTDQQYKSFFKITK